MIREDDQYSGVRVTLTVDLHTAKLSVKVDVNVGDPIWPAPEDVALPRLLTEESLILRGYPLHMVLGEKLVTAIDRGSANTRWRDFADIYLLSRHHPVAGADLAEATLRVADHRGVELAPLTEVLDGLAGLAQSRWVAWRAKQDLTDRLPEAFSEVVNTCNRVGSWPSQRACVLTPPPGAADLETPGTCSPRAGGRPRYRRMPGAAMAPCPTMGNAVKRDVRGPTQIDEDFDAVAGEAVVPEGSGVLVQGFGEATPTRDGASRS